MPGPQPKRLSAARIAASAARRAPFAAGPGLRGVTRRDRAPVESSRLQWVYDDYESANFYFTAGGTVAPGATANITTLSSSSGAFSWFSTTATSVTIEREGIYYVQYGLSLTGTLGVGYVRATYGLTGRDFFPEPGALPRDGIDSEVVTPISVGWTLGPAANVALSLNNRTTNTLTLGATLTVGIVAVLLA